MRIVSASVILDVFDSAGVLPLDRLMGDSSYVLPTAKWLGTVFPTAWEQFIRGLQVQDYAPEKNDCDNFARLCAAFASILHRRTPGAPAAELAFGEFWFIRANGEPHAICVAVVPVLERRAELTLSFFEPQLPARPIALNSEEIQSCTGIRL